MFLNAKQYATRVANELRKIDQMEFFTEIHDQFYPNVEIEFMEEFVNMLYHTGEFVVEGEKLRKYGIMTSDRSSNIRKKLDDLGLIKDEDYQLLDVQQLRPQGGTSIKKQYLLTPAAFKKCLMRAQRRANQPVDPTIYIDYFQLFEATFELYRIYQDSYSKKIISMKDDKIDRLEATLKEQGSKHRDELAETMRLMREEANRQRAEILGETKSAHDEVKKAREDIGDLHKTVADQHAATIDMMQHASVEVKASERQYFAMTAYQREGDESGRLYFRTWRCKSKDLTVKLVRVMANTSTDKSGKIKYTKHHLVIPPIYFAGAVNVGIAGKSKLEVLVTDILSELNESLTKKDKRYVSIDEFKKRIGLKIGSVHLMWSPNDYITHCQFVDCFLDNIKNVKSVKLAVAEPKLQARIDKNNDKQFQSLINTTGKAREDLARTIEIIERARETMKEQPSSEDDLTDHEE